MVKGFEIIEDETQLKKEYLYETGDITYEHFEEWLMEKKYKLFDKREDFEWGGGNGTKCVFVVW